MSSTLSNLGLVLATATPGVPTPPTYNRGTKTLDHIWVCRKLHTSVTGYGYLPQHSIMSSDHRGVFLHVEMKMQRYLSVPRIGSRKLSSRNPASVVRYLDNLRPQVANHNLREKTDLLMSKESLTSIEAKTLQTVDQMYTKMQLSSESSLYKHKTKHDFSGKLHDLKCYRRYWRRILRLSKYSDTHESLTALNPEHTEENIRKSRKEILHELRRVGLRISEALIRQDAARTEHLKKRACLEPLVYESGTYKTIGNVEAMMKHETVRKDWASIKAAMKSSRESAPSIEIPEHTREVKEMWELLKTKRTPKEKLKWEDIFCDETIENMMIDWCVLHFAQASETPLASSDWFEKLDINNPDNMLDEILDGRVEEPPEQEGIRAFFQAAGRKSRKLNIEIDYKHFKSFALS